VSYNSEPQQLRPHPQAPTSSDLAPSSVAPPLPRRFQKICHGLCQVGENQTGLSPPRWPRAGGLRPESPNGDSAEVRAGTSCDPIRLGVGRHSQRQSHGWRGVLLKHLDGSSAFRLSSVIRNTSFNTNHSNGRVISIVPQSVHTLGLFQQQTPNVGHAL
jgi:hypothetical protein